MREEFGVTVYRIHELLKDVVDDPAGAIVPAIDHRAGGTDRAVAVGDAP